MRSFYFFFSLFSFSANSLLCWPQVALYCSYTLISKNRSLMGWGGLAFIIKDDIKFKVIEIYLYGLKEAVDCVKEQMHDKSIVQFIENGLNNAIERKPVARADFGKLLRELLTKQLISREGFVKGFRTILEGAIDIIVDIPQLFENLAQILVPALEQDAQCLHTVKDMEQLVSEEITTRGRLAAAVLAELVKSKDKETAARLWHASVLTWESFGAKTSDNVEQLISSKEERMRNTGEQLREERDKMEGQRQEEQRQQVRLAEERTLFEEERRKFEQEKRKLKEEAQRKCAEEKHLLEKQRARKAKELEKQMEEMDKRKQDIEKQLHEERKRNERLEVEKEQLLGEQLCLEKELEVFKEEIRKFAQENLELTREAERKYEQEKKLLEEKWCLINAKELIKRQKQFEDAQKLLEIERAEKVEELEKQLEEDKETAARLWHTSRLTWESFGAKTSDNVQQLIS
ncbi:putative golgin subfamily A member 6-like protein 3 isoform X3 [Artemia franciscana]|uniref:putative golgin subfamily A member 6-like protein 3 isoform X3 n=1 Tax=Artemia franciscana TaxID=6661 RepID=UPI0032DA9C12